MAEVESYQEVVVTESSEELISFESSSEVIVEEENVVEVEATPTFEIEKEEEKTEEIQISEPVEVSEPIIDDEVVVSSGVEDLKEEIEVIETPAPEVAAAVVDDDIPAEEAKPHVNGVLSTPAPEEFAEPEPAVQEVAETVEEKDDGQLKSPLALWIMDQNLPPQVVDLIYWADLQRTTGVCGGLLLLLLSLRSYPLIVVVTTTMLALLVVAFLYRIAMTILNTLQKTTAEHPFKNLLEDNIEIPAELVEKYASKARIVINEGIRKLQCLFLVQDTAASLKAMIVCWLISYVASCVNFLTLCIFATFVVFTVPKLYEEKQKEVDQLLALAMEKGCVALTLLEQKLPEKVKVYLKREKKD